MFLCLLPGRKASWLVPLTLLFLSVLGTGVRAQSATTIIDFENFSGTLTTSPELDALGVSFGTPTPTLTGLPTSTSLLGPVTVFERDGAPSGRNVAANCTGGIGCEFPSDAVVVEFSAPVDEFRFEVLGFQDADFILVYGYDADGRVERLARVPVSTRWQSIEVDGALGYVIDLEASSAVRTFYLDDLEYLPAPPDVVFDCSTGDRLLERLVEDLPFRREYDRIQQLTQEYLAGLAVNDELGFGGEVTTIPVVVHVVYNNATENISAAQVQSQVDVLNEIFRAANPDIGTVPSAFSSQVADLRIQFALAQRDPNCEPTNGITRTETDVSVFVRDRFSADATVRNPIKFNSSGGNNGWPSDEYLNIWVGDIGDGLLGYASWPADLAGRPAEDGVVMDYTAFGTLGTAGSPFDLGRVCAHEVGHWLNLQHIWGDDSAEPDICSGTDEVADTPNQGSFNRNCPSFPSTSCDNDPDGDMFMNHMDYTDDNCRTMFTLGQHVRAAASLFTARTALLGSEGHLPPPASPASPDLWSADTYDDTGAEPNPTAEVMYHSADIWVRPTNDGRTNQEHVNPVYRADGSPNYVYVRVRNRGCAGSESGTVRLYWGKASSGLSWPAPWDGSVTSPAPMGDDIGSQAVTVGGGEFTVLEFPWVVPDPADYASFGADRSHFCLLSRIEDADGMTFPESSNLWNNVKNNNNIVWKNISIGESAEGAPGGFNQIIVGNFGDEEGAFELQFSLPGDAVRSPFDYGRLYLRMGDLFEIWRQNGEGADVEPIGDNTVELLAEDAVLFGIPLKSGELYPVDVVFVPFEQGQINTVHRLNLTQVVAQTQEPFGGNQFWWRTFAEGVRLPPLDDPGGDNSPPIFVDYPETVPTGCEFPLTVRVDMSNVPKPDHLLGNFTFALRYDPSVMEYVGDGQVLSDFTGFVNPQPGVVFFNGASATGQPGNVPVFTGNFRAIGGPGENVNPVLEMRTLVSAVTFTDLSSTASIFNCGFPIQEEQLLGDVDGDGRVTSTDAAYVLAFAVNNPIPERVLARIEAGFGNVDGNRRTNARDALIILSYDIGLPVDFPVATPICPGAGPGDGLLTEERPVGRSALSVPLEIGLLTEGEDLLVPLTVDMTTSGERLGSYQFSASWDATRYEFVALVPSVDPAFAHPNVNLAEVGQGNILLAHAAPGGGAELLTLATLRLRPLTEATDPELDLRVEDLTAAGSFRSLVPVISRNETTSADDLQLEKLDVFAVPNPFRGSTALTVRTVTAGPLQVEVFDSRGRLVETLISGERAAGSHALRWEPLAGQAPGVYLVRVRAGVQVLTRRVMLLR